MKTEEYKGSKKVYVDIFTWIKNAEELGRVPMEGIYRHTEALAKRYTPAILLEEGETVPNTGLALVSKVLGKGIKCFGFSCFQFDQFAEEVDVWLSIALDSVTPLFDNPQWPKSVKRVTIVHDLLAAKGVFGAGNKANFEIGARHSDVFLPVSKTTKEAFRTWLTANVSSGNDKVWIDYSCFHDFDVLPPYLFKHERAAGLGTWYPRKRVGLAFDLARIRCLPYHHVGRYGMPPDYEFDFTNILLEGSFTFYGPLSDENARRIIAGSSLFFCLSEEEGFSMTPMEAIILGVPYVVVSAIPVHQEIYSGNEVTFLFEEELAHYSSHFGDWRNRKLIEATPRDREYLFEKYKFEKVISPFEAYLSKL